MNNLCKSCAGRVAGRIYKCCVCSNYELCRKCYYCGEHNADHAFEGIDPDVA